MKQQTPSPNKQALVVVSFGTTDPAARKAIETVERYLAAQCPERDCLRAFTSGMIIERIRREQQLSIPTPEQLMQQLLEQGYTDVICQPLHILNGWEYEKMCRQIAPYAGQFSSFRVGKPMLTDFSDYEACCQIIEQNMPLPQDGEALVLMGHGSDHFANAAYCQLESVLRDRGWDSIHIGTVESYPSLAVIQKRLRKSPVERVTLMPFFIVAGDHAQNDLAGEDDDSWKSILEQEGYAVTVHLKGMGEFPETGALFARHVTEAQPFSTVK